MQQFHQFGKEAEQSAEELLSKQPGWTLVDRNYRCRGGEIDLIFEELRPDGRPELVFVEVRARDPLGWVDGVESVDWKKQRRLQRAASWFLVSYEGPAIGARFDILAWDRRSWRHVRDAWHFS